MDRIGLIYAPLCALSPTPWGWIEKNNGKWRLKERQCTDELRSMANSGANYVRLLALAPWLEGGVVDQQRIFSPFPQGAGHAFTLKAQTPEYYSVVRRVAEIANASGLTLWLDLFDHCGATSPNSPWVTNDEGVHGYADPGSDGYTSEYIRTMVEALRGLDVIYGWGNEFRDRDETEFCLRVVAPTLAECGVLWERQAYGADNLFKEPCEQDFQKARLEDLYGLEAKLRTIRPVHGIGVDYSRAELIASWWGRNPIRKALSDDGVFDGDSVLDVQTDNPTRRRPSPDQWRSTIRRLRERQPSPTLEAPQLPGLWTWAFEHSPKQWQTEPTFLEVQAETLSAMADEIEAWQGSPMENRGKFQPIVEPAEPPKPEPAPEPVQEGPIRHCWLCVWWRRWLCWWKIRPKKCRR
ncbi:MAG: hypothetical protein BWY99_02511 [Synergistetes bacterium ADurb.BinA166]|nr:MAG: hypothetical protein BWY99_02511 [Synergistetes bacterium ADurb.BinA166]